jgi:hypothetical protein
MKTPNIFYSYKKAKKVVNTCETYEQLQGAKRYINCFLEMYKEILYRNGELEVNNVTAELYDRLTALVFLKKHQLKNK